MAERNWVFLTHGVTGFFGDGEHPVALNLDHVARMYVTGGESAFHVVADLVGGGSNTFLPTFSSRGAAETALSNLLRDVGRAVFE